jgi:hypothetical protein
VCGVELIGSNDSLQFLQAQDGLHLTLPNMADAAGLGDIAYVLRIHSSCKEHGQTALRNNRRWSVNRDVQSISDNRKKPDLISGFIVSTHPMTSCGSHAFLGVVTIFKTRGDKPFLTTRGKTMVRPNHDTKSNLFRSILPLFNELPWQIFGIGTTFASANSTQSPNHQSSKIEGNVCAIQTFFFRR